jgi:hypothetical protein
MFKIKFLKTFLIFFFFFFFFFLLFCFIYEATQGRVSESALQGNKWWKQAEKKVLQSIRWFGSEGCDVAPAGNGGGLRLGWDVNDDEVRRGRIIEWSIWIVLASFAVSALACASASYATWLSWFKSGLWEELLTSPI